MPESTFAEFAKFIDDALDEFRLAHADVELVPEKQTLSDWWTCFSLVVVPDLLLRAETPRGANHASFQSAELAISTADQAFLGTSEVLHRSFPDEAKVSR